ncbi:conserved virulence factor C family protein [Ammoniphilus sp. 3BR4]|uniref:conserved virulence factor C family protein n=1 Tax=Ammoniphilus sp. 3BR4 TaxID=3158265 RepID=UPI00346631E0
MQIISIEPTPSPNVMKINVDEALPLGVSQNFTKEKRENAPEIIDRLLNLEGVVGVFQVNDFIALERHPKADWKQILADVGKLFGHPSFEGLSKPSSSATFGEVHVFVQMFKGIPMQVKLSADGGEMRLALPEQFGNAVMAVQSASQNLILERQWVDQGIRYGTFKEVGEEVVTEVIAAYDGQRLQEIISEAVGQGSAGRPPVESISPDALTHPEWEKRFAALERMNPTAEDIPILAKALHDTKMSIRRLATVYLGMIGNQSLPHLFLALKDKSPAVRRTAGDAISDIGDPLAIGPMAERLQDPNKLVRWRAARFLFEVGDRSAIPALQEALNDSEFEVSLQAKLALERIERGEEASGTVWQQITQMKNINRPK